MVDIDEFINNFIIDVRNDINKDNAELNHCVILYKTKHNASIVHKIYKNIDEFTLKAKKDISEVDISFGVRVQLWYFD